MAIDLRRSGSIEETEALKAKSVKHHMTLAKYSPYRRLTLPSPPLSSLQPCPLRVQRLLLQQQVLRLQVLRLQHRRLTADPSRSFLLVLLREVTPRLARVRQMLRL